MSMWIRPTAPLLLASLFLLFIYLMNLYVLHPSIFIYIVLKGVDVFELKQCLQVHVFSLGNCYWPWNVYNQNSSLISECIYWYIHTQILQDEK